MGWLAFDFGVFILIKLAVRNSFHSHFLFHIVLRRFSFFYTDLSANYEGVYFFPKYHEPREAILIATQKSLERIEGSHEPRRMRWHLRELINGKVQHLQSLG